MSTKKAILQYDLTDYDSELDFKLAVHSKEMGIFIWELRNNLLRTIYKNALNVDQALKLIEDELNELPFDINDLII